MRRRVWRQQVWHLYIVQAAERNGCRGQVAAARLGLGGEAGGQTAWRFEEIHIFVLLQVFGLFSRG